MARDELALYLVLSPEFGGTRFGPFEGLEVRLGADRERCHIVLPEAFGVAREHCKVIRQGDGGLIVAPSERTAAVFVWKGDARRGQQIQTPTALRPGDRFSLVSPEGARFTIEIAPLPAEVLAQREKKRGRRNNLTAEGFAKEGWRLLLARIWTLGPFGLAARAWYMFTSGALLQPRILIPLAIAAVGYIGTLGSSCAAFKYRLDATKKTDELAECKQREGFGSSGGGLADKSSRKLIAEIVGSSALGAALETQDELSGKIEKHLASVFESQTEYQWLLGEGGDAKGQWIRWREAIGESDSFDPATKVLLPYAAAIPKRSREDWNVQLDVTNKRSCMRGPAMLTFRQARSLGLAPMLDAYRGDETAGFTNDDAGRLKLLTEAAFGANEPPPDQAIGIEESQLASGMEFCLFASGEDERSKMQKALGAFERHFGTNGNAVPETSKNEAPISRLMKLQASDVPGNRYEDNDTPRLDFRNSFVAPLKEEPTKEAILERSAEVIARAVGLPCMMALASPDTVDATFGRSVDPVVCLVLEYKIRHKGQ